jgi:hypothetical protein
MGFMKKPYFFSVTQARIRALGDLRYFGATDQSIGTRVFIVKVLHSANERPLAVQLQRRPRASCFENLDGDPRRQRQRLQSNADLGQALTTLKLTAIFGTQVTHRSRYVNAAVLEEPIDDREAAVHSGQSNGIVVTVRGINAHILHEALDDRDATMRASKSDGLVTTVRRVDAFVLKE